MVVCCLKQNVDVCEVLTDRLTSGEFVVVHSLSPPSARSLVRSPLFRLPSVTWTGLRFPQSTCSLNESFSGGAFVERK